MVINGASRLPGGVGLRVDVAKLVSHSSYVRKDANLDKWLNVVRYPKSYNNLVNSSRLKAL